MICSINMKYTSYFIEFVRLTLVNKIVQISNILLIIKIFILRHYSDEFSLNQTGVKWVEKMTWNCSFLHFSFVKPPRLQCCPMSTETDSLDKKWEQWKFRVGAVTKEVPFPDCSLLFQAVSRLNFVCTLKLGHKAEAKMQRNVVSNQEVKFKLPAENMLTHLLFS